MKITNIGNFKSIDAFVNNKISELEKTDRTFKSIYSLSVREKENIFCESNDGYKITKTTYGEMSLKVDTFAHVIESALGDIKRGNLVGLYMQNSEAWLEIFWALMKCGFKPLLLNTRMGGELLDSIIYDYKVSAVISDDRSFAVKTVRADEITNSQLETEPFTDEYWENEVVFTSSGTTMNVKLCCYTGENMYYQVCDSARIIHESRNMQKHYKGELKQLTFLPFYHIFGFSAVFMWFSFFSRTFVFLNDFAPATIQNTVKRHKVTHIFAVPLLWETVYKSAMKGIAQRGEKTLAKFEKGMRIYEKIGGVPVIGKAFIKTAFREIRENIFGDSISFLISGGSAISTDTLKFLNAIGYHFANGYGMSEVGITSVELSDRQKDLISGSVGKPFYSVEYRINESGELLIRGKTLASKVFIGGKPVEKDADGWFNSLDMAEEKNGRYYILGRKDDVIITANGENLNPDITENLMKIDGAQSKCITTVKSGENTLPVLVVGVAKYLGGEALDSIRHSAENELRRLGADSTIGRILLTADPLMLDNDFKLNRKSISARIESGEIREASEENSSAAATELEKKLCELFGEVLNRDGNEIASNAHFFFDLGGTSLEYITLVINVQKEFGVSFPQNSEGSLSTVQQFAEFIKENG